METLFRMVLRRPAVEQSEDLLSIELTQNSSLQAAMAQVQDSDNVRQTLKAIAAQFVDTSNDFVDKPNNLPIYGSLNALSLRFDALEEKVDISPEDVSNAIKETFNKTAKQLVQQNALESSIKALKDSIIAIKQLPDQHNKNIEGLSNQLRDINVILNVADDAAFPANSALFKRYRRRTLRLPTQAELQSSLAAYKRQKEIERQRKQAEEKKRKQAEANFELYQSLNSAIEELTNLSADHLKQSPQTADAGFLMPSANRPVNAFIQQMNVNQQLSQLNLLRAQSSLGDSTDEKSKTTRRLINFSSVNANDLADKKTSTINASRDFIASKGPFTPLKLAEIGFFLKSNSDNNLSNQTRELLKERNIEISQQPLDHIVETLQQEVDGLSKALDQQLGRPTKNAIKRVGNTMLMIKMPMPSAWNNIVTGIGHFTPDIFVLPDDRIPHSHGSIAPVGVADLLVIKQQLVRYEGVDVAHIENVLRGERKEREHTRRRETEELLFSETEVTTSEERSLESTSRFEMSRETSETIQEDASLKAGLTVSGKYGPVVEFSASAEGSISRSKQEATKSAAKFSQDVTQRSANKVTERLLERSSLRVTNEVIDKNGHLLDNTDGDGHISGVYQWVNKVYQAQIYNYGIRTMYDFMVPEPGAFLIDILQSTHANALEIEKPMEFILRPDQISEYNYHTWVQAFGATDVSPPPEIYLTKSLDFQAGGGDDKTDYNHSGQIQIDEGYKAVHGTVGITGNVWEDSADIDVVIGTRTHRFSGAYGVAAWSTSLADERDSLPFALNTFKYSDIAVAVEVKCQRTDRALMKWRLDTHAKLTNAYKARLSEYEEKLAALEVQAGIAIEGKNPALNLEMMKDELKKHCISIMTEQHFDLFDAISTGSQGFPQIDLHENEGEGPYVRFFEQAFEWEHITWVTYPYFWGRKGLWDERVTYEDTDTLFNQFLKAGYCRVTVPARPGFEGAIDHFMTYGEIWNGGPLPAISSELYLPIADELAERLDRPGEEFPEGDPWLVRIPTTLVHLREDDQLPAWAQNEEGEWVEVAVGD